MRYYILQQDSKGALIQVDSITRKTSSWSDSSIFTSLDTFIENTSFWDKYNPTFDICSCTVLCCSDEKITKQSHPEFFI